MLAACAGRVEQQLPTVLAPQELLERGLGLWVVMLAVRRGRVAPMGYPEHTQDVAVHLWHTSFFECGTCDMPPCVADHKVQGVSAVLSKLGCCLSLFPFPRGWCCLVCPGIHTHSPSQQSAPPTDIRKEQSTPPCERTACSWDQQEATAVGTKQQLLLCPSAAASAGMQGH
jgi:hypothetical protein